MRGQLVHLAPLSERYMLSSSGYLFARGDVVIWAGRLSARLKMRRRRLLLATASWPTIGAFSKTTDSP